MATYKVNSGDTLSAIGKKYGVNYMDIAKANGIADPNKIYTGQVLNIPDGSVNSASASNQSGAGNAILKSPIAGVSDQMYTDYHNMKFEESAETTANKNKRDEAAAKIENHANSEASKRVEQVLSEIENMKPFSYDFSTDPMFQNMLGSYQAMGKNAMKDTVAQSSALTGGYGNSWAQTAGQQKYNQYLQDAFDNLPEYYQLALSAYESERDALLDKYGLYSSERQNERDALESLFDLYSGLYEGGYKKDYDSYKEILGKLATEMEWLNSEDWKRTEYNATQADRAAKLAMQEAEMEANGYEKQSDGSWEYVGGDDPYAFMDYYYEGAKAAKEEGDYALYEYFYKLPISDSEKSALLSSIGKANDFMQYYDPISDIKEMLRDPTLSTRDQNELKNRILARYEGTPEYERVKKALQ